MDEMKNSNLIDIIFFVMFFFFFNLIFDLDEDF